MHTCGVSPPRAQFTDQIFDEGMPLGGGFITYNIIDGMSDLTFMRRAKTAILE
jgi:hypothetical protein